MKHKSRLRILLILMAVLWTIMITCCNKQESPSPIPEYYSAIAAGGYHALALEPDGTLWAWGRNQSGQLGDGMGGVTRYRFKPWKIDTGYAVIAAGGFHSLALHTNGTLWAWGLNDSGQLGDSSYVCSDTPVLIDSGYSVIAAGRTHSLAIKKDGKLWAWGGQLLGDETKTSSNTPIQIGGQ